MTRFPHHQATIERATAHFAQQPTILGLLLGGSVAHGYARADSDVDVMLLISDEEHARRLVDNDAHFFSVALCTYPDSYVDGKYVSERFLAQVDRQGSEPTRYAFKDAEILFSRIGGLAERVERAARYPVEEKLTRLKRFYAQFEAWYWYASEGHKKQNPYLLTMACSKLALFGGRMILAHNEVLYPYHKWFLEELKRAPEQPAGLLDQIQRLTAAPTMAHASMFYDLISGFRAWETDPYAWAMRFMADSELNWLVGQPAVDDL